MENQIYLSAIAREVNSKIAEEIASGLAERLVEIATLKGSKIAPYWKIEGSFEINMYFTPETDSVECFNQALQIFDINWEIGCSGELAWAVWNQNEDRLFHESVNWASLEIEQFERV